MYLTTISPQYQHMLGFSSDSAPPLPSNERLGELTQQLLDFSRSNTGNGIGPGLRGLCITIAGLFVNLKTYSREKVDDVVNTIEDISTNDGPFGAFYCQFVFPLWMKLKPVVYGDDPEKQKLLYDAGVQLLVERAKKEPFGFSRTVAFALLPLAERSKAY